MAFNCISIQQLIAEINGHNLIGTIDTTQSTDAFKIEHATCCREDCAIKIFNHNRCLSLDLDFILRIECTECQHHIREYKITTINSTIILDSYEKEEYELYIC